MKDRFPRPFTIFDVKLAGSGSGLRYLLIALLALFFSACNSRSHTSQSQESAKGNFQNHTYLGKIEPDDGQWVRPAKDYASTRFSSHDQVNTGNVKDLKLAFTFSTATERGLEAAPQQTRADGKPSWVEALEESLLLAIGLFSLITWIVMISILGH